MFALCHKINCSFQAGCHSVHSAHHTDSDFPNCQEQMPLLSWLVEMGMILNQYFVHWDLMHILKTELNSLSAYWDVHRCKLDLYLIPPSVTSRCFWVSFSSFTRFLTVCTRQNDLFKSTEKKNPHIGRRCVEQKKIIRLGIIDTWGNQYQWLRYVCKKKLKCPTKVRYCFKVSDIAHEGCLYCSMAAIWHLFMSASKCRYWTITVLQDLLIDVKRKMKKKKMKKKR